MNLKSNLIAVILLLTYSGAMAQGNDLVGTWCLDIHKAIDVMAPANKNHYDTLSAKIKELAVSRMNGREFIFSQNGEITVNWKSRRGQEVSKGQWEKDEPQGKISITINSQASVYDYEFLSVGVLIMRMENKQGFFDNLYLEKIN